MSNIDISTACHGSVETCDVSSSDHRKGIQKPVGVVVSVNYANCLERILPFNLRHLESLIVVTTPDDVATKQVCAKHSKIRVIETDLFFRYGAKFNKGAAIELALMMIPKDKWCLIFDADICFPADMFLLDKLDRNTIYGASRTLVYTEEQFAKAVIPRNFDLSGLPQEPRDTGVLGMFQLFHPQACALENKRPWYGINYYNASWCDNIFYWKWPKSQRIVLPIRLIHLGHRNNWTGKVEGKFPRPETVYSKAEEKISLAISCDEISKAIICEANRLEKTSVEMIDNEITNRQICR